MTHLRIWKFRPAAGREDEFAAAYGPDGAWPALFRRADGYLGTELYRPEQPGGWWLTIDRWTSATDFERFGALFGAEYRVLDDRLAGVAGDEEFVGAFGAEVAEGHMDDT
jgi:hypothetical protein